MPPSHGGVTQFWPIRSRWMFVSSTMASLKARCRIFTRKSMALPALSGRRFRSTGSGHQPRLGASHWMGRTLSWELYVSQKTETFRFFSQRRPVNWTAILEFPRKLSEKRPPAIQTTRPCYLSYDLNPLASHSNPNPNHWRPTEILIIILILIVISCQRADYDYDHDYDYDRIVGNHSLAETQKTSINAGYSQGVTLPMG